MPSLFLFFAAGVATALAAYWWLAAMVPAGADILVGGAVTTAIIGLGVAWARAINWSKGPSPRVTVTLRSLAAVAGVLIIGMIGTTVVALRRAPPTAMEDQLRAIQTWTFERFAEQMPAGYDRPENNAILALATLPLDDTLQPAQQRRLAEISLAGVTTETRAEAEALIRGAGLDGGALAAIVQRPSGGTTGLGAPDKVIPLRHVITGARAIAVQADIHILDGQTQSAVPHLLWLAGLEDPISAPIELSIYAVAQGHAWARLEILALEGKLTSADIAAARGVLDSLPATAEAYWTPVREARDAAHALDYLIEMGVAPSDLAILYNGAARVRFADLRQEYWPSVALPSAYTLTALDVPPWRWALARFGRAVTELGVTQGQTMVEGVVMRRALSRFILALAVGDDAGSVPTHRESGTPLTWARDGNVVSFSLPKPDGSSQLIYRVGRIAGSSGLSEWHPLLTRVTEPAGRAANTGG